MAQVEGTTKWFVPRKGYGVIVPDAGGEDVFVHQAELQMDGFRQLRKGQRVSYTPVTSDDGKLTATSVTLIGEIIAAKPPKEADEETAAPDGKPRMEKKAKGKKAKPATA